MKKYIIIAIVLLFPLCLFADEPVKAIYAKITDPDNKEITVVAHRADWRFAPEIRWQRLKVLSGWEPTWWNWTFRKPKTDS